MSNINKNIKEKKEIVKSSTERTLAVLEVLKRYSNKNNLLHEIGNNSIKEYLFNDFLIELDRGAIRRALAEINKISSITGYELKKIIYNKDNVLCECDYEDEDSEEDYNFEDEKSINKSKKQKKPRAKGYYIKEIIPRNAEKVFLLNAINMFIENDKDNNFNFLSESNFDIKVFNDSSVKIENDFKKINLKTFYTVAKAISENKNIECFYNNNKQKLIFRPNKILFAINQFKVKAIINKEKDSFYILDLSKIQDAQITERNILTIKKNDNCAKEIEIKIKNINVISEIKSNFIYEEENDNVYKIYTDTFTFLPWAQSHLKDVEVLKPINLRITLQDFLNALTNNYNKTEDDKYYKIISEVNKSKYDERLYFDNIDLSKREEFKLLNFCTHVSLINNNLKDVDFLSAFDNLKKLIIVDNPINNLMISNDANLFILDLKNTEIKDFSFLLNKQFNSLHSLRINSKYQFDFSFLNGEIEGVDIFASNVINIESIRKLNKINKIPISLGWYDTTSTKQNFNTLLLNLPNKPLIDEIRLKTNGTIDLHELCNLPNLSKLYLNCNDCDDIEGIDVFENLPSLRNLTILTKKEFDLKYLRYSNVRKLNIFCNHLKNIEYLKEIENLYEVYISAKTIEGDIDSLEKCVKFNLSIKNRNIEISSKYKENGIFRIKVCYSREFNYL